MLRAWILLRINSPSASNTMRCRLTVVAAALACAGVSGMQGRVVDDFQPNRLEFGQPLVEQGFDVVGQVQAGSAFLNGLTITFS